MFRVDKKRDKLDRQVLDSQERAFWDVHRPAVSRASLKRNIFPVINDAEIQFFHNILARVPMIKTIHHFVLSYELSHLCVYRLTGTKISSYSRTRMSNQIVLLLRKMKNASHMQHV